MGLPCIEDSSNSIFLETKKINLTLEKVWWTNKTDNVKVTKYFFFLLIKKFLSVSGKPTVWDPAGAAYLLLELTHIC